jgi:hypothetical protein
LIYKEVARDRLRDPLATLKNSEGANSCPVNGKYKLLNHEQDYPIPASTITLLHGQEQSTSF